MAKLEYSDVQSMKKRIAFVVAIPGTAQAFLKNHFEKLVKIYDVVLIANFPTEKSKQEFIDMGVNCMWAPIMRPINIKNDLRALSVLIKIFKRERFDSIHSVTPKAGLLTAMAGRIAGIKIRIHIYTGQVWATRKGVMRVMLKQMDKLIARLDTHLLVDGDSQRQFLINEGVLKPENSRVLAHGSICGVKLEHFNVSADIRKAERDKFGFKDSDVVFIFLGRLNHDKGIGELYEAFNRLASELSNAKLMLYGTDEEGYEAKAADYPNLKRDVNFYYPGSTSRPYDVLQGGDVFVLPTWREGFGSSVIEAQALALPVITSDAYGVVDASVDKRTGLRCGVNDPDGLYRCMKQYYEDVEMRKLHGLNGRKRVEELFDYKVVTAAWVEYYREILK